DRARLMVVDRLRQKIEHRRFFEISDYLFPGDVLVMNNTKVIPARLVGRKQPTGAKIEALLLRRLDHCRWEALVKPGKRARPGTEIVFGSGEMTALVKEATDAGGRVLQFSFQGSFDEKLEELGQTPLPPYIHQPLRDPDRYQTIYARHSGSVAAPTAGLHFTEDLLARIRAKGVEIVELTLHVGLGTFRPVQVQEIEKHTMHSEYYRIGKEAAQIINRAKAAKRRVIAVGTTTVRTLETAVGNDGLLYPSQGWTDIFIYPGYSFKLTDCLITNFHLPRSSLLMLVSAFAGIELIRYAYQKAIENNYRFFSFGDAMFLI
ncbi:MAG: tRNA preQ1(34) S-adenosylmethionine ribosyltransferase-isomerase QueA, partial [Clostridia bacterium]|nr:tRNA preQ1(34) S-adenosylmethionine ribosyltransferase-isomerase QueA [Clostridia bacterium]